MTESHDEELPKVDLNSVSPSFSSVEIGDQEAPLLRRINLSKAVGPKNLFATLKLQEQNTTNFIRRLRAGIAGILAISLWVALIAVGFWQTSMTGFITTKILELESLDNTEDGNIQNLDLQIYDKAIALVSNTSTTLYAVITPLATAITGFYFVTEASIKKSSIANDDNDE